MDSIDLIGALRAQGIHDERVLRAIAEVPRDRFVPPPLRESAWEDQALAIGWGQTISQPFIVAFMLQALGLTGGERVLDVGTGSGYQAALLSRLCAEVYSIEIVPPLHEAARELLLELGAANVRLRLGDGWNGWAEAAPFQGIVSASAAPNIPRALEDQLAPGGRLVLPVGPPGDQRLYLVRRGDDGVREVEKSIAVRFVPMTGEASSQ
ncbi:MAG TPA: protein-L-isoaspartate(D-aspartate) O-methyltransferase [Myxococcales bacterium]|jgi:protein-L-isoaspartate(D-aspartate) O-methyltransferase